MVVVVETVEVGPTRRFSVVVIGAVEGATCVVVAGAVHVLVDGGRHTVVDVTATVVEGSSTTVVVGASVVGAAVVGPAVVGGSVTVESDPGGAGRRTAPAFDTERNPDTPKVPSAPSKAHTTTRER